MSDGYDNEYELIMPFTVCKSNGGEYDDAAFVAGWQGGRIDAELRAIQGTDATLRYQVAPGLVPQLDLLAMKYGYRVACFESGEGCVGVSFIPSSSLRGDDGL